MIRRHFIAGDDKPDIIITYHSSKHIPFFGGKKTRNLLMNASYGNMEADDFKSPISINIVLDTWNGGVGQWGIKFNDSKVFNCYGLIGILDNEYVLGYAEVYLDFNNGESIFNHGYIKSIIFDDNITHINDSIIVPGANSESILKEVTLPNSLKYLTGSTFVGHKNLKSLIIPENVIRIDDLVHIYKLNSLDNDALETITLLPFNPPLVSNGDYGPLGSKSSGELINPNFKIRVYADCIDTYKNDAVWGQYSDLYDIINNAIVYYTEDGSRKIYEQTDTITSMSNIASDVILNAVDIYLPNSITTLSLRAYENLKEFTIPDGVTTLLKRSIHGCGNLEKLTINDNIVSAENDSISYCNNLNTILFNNNNIGLSNIVLNSQTNLKRVIIGNNVTLLVLDSFKSLSNLQEVSIPNTITIIPSGCFLGCMSLQTIQIPNSVTSIGSSAFGNCKKLTSITFQGTIAQWNEIDFGGSWNDNVPATVVHCTDGDVEIS